jgi:hypothetical protein
MSDIKTNVYTYTVPYRNTKMGGYTKYIGICMQCRKVVNPIRVRRSKAGTHGEDYYSHEHPLVFIVLEQSNSGNRYIVVPEELRTIREELERMWIYEDATVGEIIKLISLYLSLSR